MRHPGYFLLLVLLLLLLLLLGMLLGFGCSAAGLTCAAVRDSAGGSGEWALEGGALVLADGGICCLDDLGAIKRETQQTILEAMERQAISVAKVRDTEFVSFPSYATSFFYFLSFLILFLFPSVLILAAYFL